MSYKFMNKSILVLKYLQVSKQRKFPGTLPGMGVKMPPDCQPSKYVVLCSDHFEDNVLYRAGQIVHLREGAVPTLFELPKHLQVKILLKLIFFKLNL